MTATISLIPVNANHTTNADQVGSLLCGSESSFRFAKKILRTATHFRSIDQIREALRAKVTGTPSSTGLVLAFDWSIHRTMAPNKRIRLPASSRCEAAIGSAEAGPQKQPCNS